MHSFQLLLLLLLLLLPILLSSENLAAILEGRDETNPTTASVALCILWWRGGVTIVQKTRQPQATEHNRRYRKQRCDRQNSSRHAG